MWRKEDNNSRAKLIFDSYSPMYSTSNIASVGAIIPIPQIWKLKLRTRRWLKWVSNPGLSQSLFWNRWASSGQRHKRFWDMPCKYSHFSPFERNTVSFSCRAAFVVGFRQYCSLKGKKPTSFSKERPKKARLSTLTLFSSAAASHSHLQCAESGRHGRTLFPIGSTTGDYSMRLWQMDIPIKFFSRVGHSINHWHHPNPTETLGHFFLMNKK